MQLLEFKNFKMQFFDRKITDACGRQVKKVLSRFGAYVRRTARQLIRSRGRSTYSYWDTATDSRKTIRTGARSSNPGEPPTNQTGLLKAFIFFGYDEPGQGVVIGPALLRGRRGEDNSVKLQALEYGGDTIIRGKSVRIAARPFMQPAFDENEKKLPEIWRQFPLT